MGLMVDLQEDYFITSNQESRFGRYDVRLCECVRRRVELLQLLHLKIKCDGFTLTDKLNFSILNLHLVTRETSDADSICHKVSTQPGS